MLTRSTTPRNDFSSPIGSCTGTTVRPNAPCSDSRLRDEARPLTVDPVQHDQARQLELLGRLPHLLGLHLDARHGVHDHEGRVGHAHRRQRVAQEVAEAGRVHQVDLVLVPLRVSQAGRQRVLAGDLFLVEVGHRRPIVHPAEAVDHAGVEQDGRRKLRLPGARVADEGDVPDAGGVVDLHRRQSSEKTRSFRRRGDGGKNGVPGEDTNANSSRG